MVALSVRLTSIEDGWHNFTIDFKNRDLVLHSINERCLQIIHYDNAVDEAVGCPN